MLSKQEQISRTTSDTTSRQLVLGPLCMRSGTHAAREHFRTASPHTWHGCISAITTCGNSCVVVLAGLRCGSLSGSGQHKPAKLALVCKSWNQLLAAPSEVWRTVELAGSRAPMGGSTAAQQLEGGGLLAWLLQRRSAIRDITFRRMPVLAHLPMPLPRPASPVCSGWKTQALHSDPAAGCAWSRWQVWVWRPGQRCGAVT